MYWAHPIKIYLERYFRLVPSYFFMMIFLSKFLSLLGGQGPRFYQFETSHSCRETWFWHVFMFNNVFPWAENDYCIKESWYLADDFWYLTMALRQAYAFNNNRKNFNYSFWAGTVFVTVITTAQICYNNFSASYLSYQDEYWTVYYDKPYTFFHCYNLGFTLGCYYFAFKYEQQKHESQVFKFFARIRDNKNDGMLCMAAGFVLQFLVIAVDKAVNSRPEAMSFAPNLLYLLLVRPTFVVGFILLILPMLVQAEFTKPLRKFLGHKFWVPFARLVFGVFLCNSVFIQFTIFNLEQGIWAEKLDTNLKFLSFLTFSFIFSLFLYLFVEAPFANLLNEFVRSRLPGSETEFYRS